MGSIDIDRQPLLAPILVSDDDHEMIALVRLVLERKCGFTVIGAPTGREVLEVLDEQPISLIISDIMKPDIDGCELVQYVRANPQTCHIPFMFLTGQTISETHAQALGVDRQMTKPFMPNELIYEVRELLELSGQLA